ncbi:HelD family protein [Streptomyces sp. NBC_01716]|uniref:HelD family protein n=1 Tax=Streptomyces sp. NBC_01716 TaxID=2975917 RepID=UPI002E331F8D|nr:AAA family ATPase [Streptomyces sp. NBC_01716]
MTSLDHELSHALGEERTYHDICRTALKGMIDGADERVATGADVSASGADAEVLGYQFRSHAKELAELPEGPLFFGRLDFGTEDGAEDGADDGTGDGTKAGAGDHAGQSYHIGRIRVSEHPASPPLVIDWRAPVSRAFYQARAADPQGVAVRRRFGWAPWSKGLSEDLTGLEDEVLRRAGPGTVRANTAPGAILAGEIERPRVGPMRDIVATIQPEQDDLVRDEVAVSVCVQGAPGTGKTAVGLHRAAYLLYTHPDRIKRGGLLILGPNRTFLSYISEVLPSLGETGVRQSTIEDEVARHPVRAEDDAATALVKHDVRMAAVLHRALYGRVRTPANSLEVPDGSYRWRVPVAELARIVADVREEAPPYAIGRERVRTRAVRLIQRQAERRAGVMNNAWLQRISRARPVSAFVDEVWPKVSPEEVVAELLSDPDGPAGPADGILDADERGALRWTRRRSARTVPWSAADLLLLDEVAGLLERQESYGHIVVDEAQDLSPMQCRAIARRAGFGSLTVLGDLAQGTTPWAARGWREHLAHLGAPDASVAQLTVGFRVPGAIVALTNRLLSTLGVDVPPATSLRADGDLRIERVREAAGMGAAVVDAVRAALPYEGSVAVIAADTDLARLREALTAAGLAPASPGELGARVTLLAASLAKGLEYDHVVAVEPATIVASERRGAHRLYVVLTRAVSRLHVLHSAELPF